MTAKASGRVRYGAGGLNLSVNMTASWASAAAPFQAHTGPDSVRPASSEVVRPRWFV